MHIHCKCYRMHTNMHTHKYAQARDQQESRMAQTRKERDALHESSLKFQHKYEKHKAANVRLKDADQQCQSLAQVCVSVLVCVYIYIYIHIYIYIYIYIRTYTHMHAYIHSRNHP
jgi:hypothetical protein